MNFSSKMDELMIPFIKSFDKCKSKDLQNKTINPILISLYKDIYEANNNIFNDGCLKSTIVPTHSIKKPTIYDSRYFPEHIKTYIDDNEEYKLSFNCGNVGGREIKIYISSFKKDNEREMIEYYTKQVRSMYIWLYICNKYAKKHCAQSLTIYIFPSPFTKILPENTTTILGPEHVNTAFTYACVKDGQLIIFRQEEWFKVFIHETFHAYGLDFAMNPDKHLNNLLVDIFPINSEYDIYESYTETWARIINCAFFSFNSLHTKNNQQEFISNMNFCLNMERMFSLYQCNKILGFMGLTYNDLHEKNNQSNYLRTKLYRENTHVFAYYVMTCIFINNYQGFMLWCNNNNENLIQYNNTPENFKSFAEYIKTEYKCISLQDGFKSMVTLNEELNSSKNKKLKKTTRMSIIDNM